ncbi:Hypothetical protein FKW44_018212 [Caligus rogercresseyi]|uniref:Uncharacterized protein n=1 Tax=Caligus rogercresseyi TaxID=217165 RepID=A0A7T8GU26_CALRO|nr:Hypothetical protein FKW44_018212 [Caligus rogercresseyi]
MAGSGKIYEKFCLLTPQITLLYVTPRRYLPLRSSIESFEAFIGGIPSSDS